MDGSCELRQHPIERMQLRSRPRQIAKINPIHGDSARTQPQVEGFNRRYAIERYSHNG